jgi:CRP-like cAMP-binding protein
MADPFILSNIRRLPLFAPCNPEQLNAVAGSFQMLRYAPGQPLYQQGENSHALYQFVSGSGQILRTTGGSGTQHVVGQVRPGEFIGEASLFSGALRDVTVVAAEESVVLLLQKAALDQLLAVRPDIQRVLNVRNDIRSEAQYNKERGVRTDETVLLTTRRHIWTFFKKTLRAVALAAAIVFVALLIGRLPSAGLLPVCLCAGGLIFPLLMAGYYYIDWQNDFFTITSQRIIHEERAALTGVVQRDQVLLNSLQNINLQRRGYIADLLGYGDVILTTAGRDKPLILDRIPNPNHVQDLIFQNSEGGLAGMGTVVTISHGSSAFSLGGFFPPMRMVEGSRITLHKHWVVLLRYIVRPIFGFVLLLGVLAVIAALGQTTLGALATPTCVLVFVLVWLVVNSFLVLWGYLSWLGDIYIIEDEQIIDIKRSPFGFSEYRAQAGLQQIQNVSSAVSSVIGRIFNYGDVYVQTAAGNSRLDFNDVANPSSVSDEILRRIQVQQSRRNNR